MRIFCVQIRSFVILLGIALFSSAVAVPSVSAHSGENEAFTAGEASGPHEVDVNEQAIKAIDLKTAKAESMPLKDTLKATGEVMADEMSVVTSVFVKQGDAVHKVQVLANVHSIDVANNLTQLLNDRTKTNAEIARVKMQYESEIKLENNRVQLAKIANDREESLVREGISARKNFQEAKSAYDSANVRLETLKSKLVQEVALLEKQRSINIQTAKVQLNVMGISAQAVDEALRTGQVTADLPIIAPVNGVVVKRDITSGERVDPAKVIFGIVNLSPIWVQIDVYQEQLTRVHVGQSVIVETPSKDQLTGRISSLGAVIDPKEKTLHVRVVAQNPNGVLRPGMFVTAEIALDQNSKTALAIPETAVVLFQERPFVYIHHQDEGHFEPAEVRLGTKSGGMVEIVSGLHESDTIATSGASQLLAQSILKPAAGHHDEGEEHHGKAEEHEEGGEGHHDEHGQKGSKVDLLIGDPSCKT